MRRYQKKQLIELANTMEEAFSHIEYCRPGAGEAGQADQMNKVGQADGMSQAGDNVLVSLCADCQDCAVAIGNAIETLAGKEAQAGQTATAQGEQTARDRQAAYAEQAAQTVALLEELCEQLYFITQEDGSLKPYIKRCRGLLAKVTYGIKYGLPDDKLEILFLPYKASMWTALESIWQAAIGYENCNVTVMPVPYYKLYLAEEKGEFAYEGEEFPDCVPTVSYKEYDIEKARPDMIFIHNPYDDTNTLTRIPDEYHSQALKQHTDLLVYSPYANFGAFNPVATHPFMCQTKALQYVDYVVVQSKKVAKLYSDAGVAKEKLLTFGSPKADAIVNKLKEKQPLPEEWERKLAGRCVILFNISLSYFIVWRNREEQKEVPDEYSYAMTVVERFLMEMGGHPDFGLIWRPHPLMKDMLRSRGLEREIEFIAEMEKLIEASENMVIDRNADYIPAFQRSDGFMTTYTSLISEYMITGKPVALYEWNYKFLEDENQPVSYLHNYFCRAAEVPLHDKNQVYRQGFLELVKSGKDPMREGRMEDAQKGFGNLNGDAGEKIFSFLMGKLQF